MPLKAIAFDAYGTLFDVYSVSSLAEELFPGKGAQLAALWIVIVSSVPCTVWYDSETVGRLKI